MYNTYLSFKQKPKIVLSCAKLNKSSRFYLYIDYNSSGIEIDGIVVELGCTIFMNLFLEFSFIRIYKSVVCTFLSDVT